MKIGLLSSLVRLSLYSFHRERGMTNTTYFYSVKRDAYSTCSSSSSLQSPESSQRRTGEVGAKSTVRSRVKAFRVSSILGLKQKVVRDDEIIQLPHQSSYSLDFMKFSFEELKTATGNLLNEHVLSVAREFKGWIHEHGLTAIELEKSIPIVIKLIDREEYEDREDEARYLGQLSHPNLVKLYGYCSYKEHQLFVFESMPQKLEDHLFKNANLLLPWSLRMKVALGVAKGLAFLHRAQVLYREFSTSFILLDTDYNAKLSDFGIPKDCLMGDKNCSSTGYESHFASGYVATGHRTTKIDVYSFGMLLLEIISGRRSSEFEEQDQAKLGCPDVGRPYKNIASEFVEERGMVKWARPYIDAKISYIVDHRLKGQYSLKSAQKVANLAFECLATAAMMRPDMDQVASKLEQLQDSKYTKFIKLEHKASFEQFLDSQDTGRDQNEEETGSGEDKEVMHEEQSSDIDMAAIMEDEGDMAAIIEEERESMLLDGR